MGKYDVKHNYTSLNPLTGEKIYEQGWIYGINSYTEAVKLLSRKKARQITITGTEFTLGEAFDVWKEKALANNFSLVTIRNTSTQLVMIQKFWTLDLPIVCITERMYLQLIISCRKYGYSDWMSISAATAFSGLAKIIIPSIVSSSTFFITPA